MPRHNYCTSVGDFLCFGRFDSVKYLHNQIQIFTGPVWIFLSFPVQHFFGYFVYFRDCVYFRCEISADSNPIMLLTAILNIGNGADFTSHRPQLPQGREHHRGKSFKKNFSEKISYMAAPGGRGYLQNIALPQTKHHFVTSLSFLAPLAVLYDKFIWGNSFKRCFLHLIS